MGRQTPSIGASRIGVHFWAMFTLVATFILLCSGGIVTSKGVGMSVPDWPTTYGYNMFLFPISAWVGGIFYEHSHRLIASGVGLITTILAIWLFAVEPRRWVKIFGLMAFIAVCLQGLLGGLRVTLYKDEIGIFHALLAQAFFCGLGMIVIATSPQFISGRWDWLRSDPTLLKIVLITTTLVFLQLGIGATMRHEHAGLSIPDFPMAYGSWIPDTSTNALLAINKQRAEKGEVPLNAALIWMQMAHRLVAFFILTGGIATAWRAMNCSRWAMAWSCLWLAMMIAQVALGAWTIWSDKAADVATIHMALGALTLFIGTLFAFRLCRRNEAAKSSAPNFVSPNLISRTA